MKIEYPKLQGYLRPILRLVPRNGEERKRLERRSLFRPAYLHSDAGWRQYSFPVSLQRGLGIVPLSGKWEDDGQMLMAFILAVFWTVALHAEPKMGLLILFTLLWFVWRTEK